MDTLRARFRRAARTAVGLGALVALVALVAPAAPAHAAVPATPAATPTFNGTVWSVAYAGSTIYVGGDFTAAIVRGKSIPRSRLAAINADTGALLDWAPEADSRVKAIAVADGAVYVAGEFAYVNGVKRDSLARLDGQTAALHSTFRHSILGKPYALAAGSGRLYLGGAITAVNGQTRTRLAAFDLRTGVLDATWRPTADDQVEALVTYGSRVYVGGKFHKINGVSGSARLAALRPDTGAVDPGFDPAPAYIAFSVAVTAAGVYAAHGGPGGRVAAYDHSGASRWTLTMDGDPQAVAAFDGTVYIGGHFDNVCRSSRTGDQGVCLDGNIPRVKLAAASATDGQVLPWTANGNGVTGVHTLASSEALGKLAVGGAFTMINGISQKRFAQFG
ncbi:MAG TPA: PQQ-binding-like beta-propeller repeat protein [Pilimelia sp.]|nr:PQQ-binding-like beta-propeller repeat protein [Pilimelia sp.]